MSMSCPDVRRTACAASSGPAAATTTTPTWPPPAPPSAPPSPSPDPVPTQTNRTRDGSSTDLSTIRRGFGWRLPYGAGVPLFLAAATTTTTIPQLVGKPLGSGWILLAGLALLLVILGAGLWLSRRTKGGGGWGTPPRRTSARNRSLPRGVGRGVENVAHVPRSGPMCQSTLLGRAGRSELGDVAKPLSTCGGIRDPGREPGPLVGVGVHVDPVGRPELRHVLEQGGDLGGQVVVAERLDVVGLVGLEEQQRRWPPGGEALVGVEVRVAGGDDALDGQEAGVAVVGMQPV